MLTLHHLENSRSIRVLWLLEELELEYKLEHFTREPVNNMAVPEFKKLHILGKAPIISDKGNVIAESGAIIEYILDHYGNGQLRAEQGTSERDKYNYWMHAAEGSIMNINTLTLVMNRFDERAPWLLKPIVKMVTGKARESYIVPNMKLILRNIENTLSQHQWFAGDEFSAADVQMGYTMQALITRGGLDDKYPNAKRWIRDMESRSAYKRAMKKNGNFQLLKA